VVRGVRPSAANVARTSWSESTLQEQIIITGRASAAMVQFATIFNVHDESVQRKNLSLYLF
jgi:hypothetical protein